MLCAHIVFICYVVFFLWKLTLWQSMYVGGGGVVLLPSPFPSMSLFCAPCCSLQVFATLMGRLTPCHLCKPTDSNPLISHSQAQPFPFSRPVSPGDDSCVLLGLLCGSAPSVPLPECHPTEAFPLCSLPTSSSGATNTCGLYYQCFNFYQYGVWLAMIHGFSLSIQ